MYWHSFANKQWLFRMPGSHPYALVDIVTSRPYCYFTDKGGLFSKLLATANLSITYTVSKFTISKRFSFHFISMAFLKDYLI
jgi:hypothetical protein